MCHDDVLTSGLMEKKPRALEAIQLVRSAIVTCKKFTVLPTKTHLKPHLLVGFVLNPIVDHRAYGKHLIPLHLRANGAVLSHAINTFLTRERESGDLVYIFEN
jgi:hypothetical protein